MLNEVIRLTNGQYKEKTITVQLTERQVIHVVDLLDIHSSSLDDVEYRNFSQAQKDDIRAFDSAIIEKLRCE